MNLSAVVTVVLRLTALGLMLRVVTAALPTLWLIVPDKNIPEAVPWLALAFMSSFAALIWAYAVPIAGAVTRRLPPQLSLGTLAVADCYTVAFLAVGLFQFSAYLGSALGWLHFAFKAATATAGTEWRESMDFYAMFGEWVPLILGILMFFNGRKWAVRLAAHHFNETPAAGDSPPPAG